MSFKVLLIQTEEDSHLVRRAPHLLVDLNHWQIQADDFVVYQKLKGTGRH